ncbi:MAG: hypothetical protein P9M13_00430 [Candidatus Ancaeobacter aquaticus]|nr:hypothetical protein [Candidatus Ancaeobacter aquaticus]
MIIMDYNIEYCESYFSVTTSGKMNANDFLSMARGIMRHPQWKLHADLLFDHRELAFCDVTLKDLEKIRAFHKEHDGVIGKGRSAILLDRGYKDAWDKLWSQGEKLSSQNTVMVFEDDHEALKWLTQQT